ncbi:hypothetical protein [Bradyrhizobium sp. STM 3809]|nr:hypothetical protein [Bradyrhizobium sp. STM 3809]
MCRAAGVERARGPLQQSLQREQRQAA